MEDIVEFILSKLALKDLSNTKLFLEKLQQGNEYEKRLLICIAIDFKGNLIDGDLMGSIFDKINYEECLKVDENLLFYERAVIESGIYVSKIENISQELNIQLTRVMKSSSFSAHFYPKIENIFNINHNWRHIKNEIDRGNLKYVKMPNNSVGDRRLVWTTPLDELREVIEESLHRAENPANEVVNRLGLHAISSTNNEYVYFEYDLDFNEYIYQPCNMSNCWLDNTSLFLSHKFIDGFGRTRDRRGDSPLMQMREKVHSSIDDKTKYNYSVKHLGVLDDFTLNISNFFNEGMQRYTK